MRLLPIALALALTACASPAPSVAPASPDPAPSLAQAAEPAPPLPLAGWIDRYVKAVGAGEEARAFRGTLLVAEGEKVVVQRRDGGGEGERYRIGSVTKPFTAVAVMQLAAAGKLSLDDSLRHHVPELPESHQGITLAQVLSHRAGLSNYTTNKALMKVRDQPKTRQEMIALIAEEPLLFEPGAKWKYSNSGYFLLGVVVERVSGQPWIDCLKERVFAPAGMTETDLSSDGLAPPLTVKDGRLLPAHAVDVSIPFAAGALVSTAEDLHRFALALMDDRLLAAKWREVMWTDRGGPVPEVGYGLGWMLRERDGVATVGHNGGIDGFSSYLELTRDAGRVVVALSHVEDVNAASVGTPALKMALTGTPIEPPKAPTFEPFDAALCTTLAGSYGVSDEVLGKLREAVGNEVAKTVARATLRCDDGYRFKPIGQGEVALKRRDDGKLVHIGHRLELTFAPAVDGAVPSFVLRQGGLTIPYERAAAP